MDFDAVVVGAGPNGLSAAVTLAQAGRSVLVVEAADRIGGGTRTDELTLPGFRHDVCSAIHPLGVASPFFRSLDLQQFGVEWIQLPLPFAHPLASGDVAVLERSVAATAARLGSDGPAYADLVQPLVACAEALLADLLRPMRIPSHPLLMARFGALALRSCRAIGEGRFAGAQARTLRRLRRALHGTARARRNRCLRPRAPAGRARIRLALCPRRVAGDCRRAR